jgi:hypothetical protein
VSNKNEMVRVYDFETKKVASIPARELASGMVKVSIQGREGEFWVEASQLKPSPPRHSEFGPEYKQVFRYLSDVLCNVYPLSVEEWEDGFRRDANPKKEIQIWVSIANSFLHLTSGLELSEEERKEAFTVIFLAYNNGPKNVLLTFTPEVLSKERVNAILKELTPEEDDQG